MSTEDDRPDQDLMAIQSWDAAERADAAEAWAQLARVTAENEQLARRLIEATGAASSPATLLEVLIHDRDDLVAQLDRLRAQRDEAEDQRDEAHNEIWALRRALRRGSAT